MSIDYDDAFERARPGSAFANGTEWECWSANWCDKCTRDAPFRNGIAAVGCPLILVALQERIPAEWMEQPRDDRGRYSLTDQYHCIEFRAPGSGGGEPRPQPDPPDMDGLFPRPERQVRMLTPAPVEPPAMVTPELVGELL